MKHPTWGHHIKESAHLLKLAPYENESAHLLKLAPYENENKLVESYSDWHSASLSNLSPLLHFRYPSQEPQ